MPNRILKESICTSENLELLPPLAEVFFYRLMVACDDYGLMDARPQILRARCFPLRLDAVSDLDVAEWLENLEDAGLLELYEVDQRPYLHLITWAKHQQIRTQRPKFPQPAEGTPTSASSCKQMLAEARKCPRNPIQSESNPNPNPILHVDANAPTRRVTKAPKELKFGVETPAYQLARRLADGIRGNDPNARLPEPGAQTERWASEMDLLIRVDKREPEQVRLVIDWSLADSFWRTNILSPQSLRRQYTRLLLKMNSPPPKHNGYATPSPAKQVEVPYDDEFFERIGSHRQATPSSSPAGRAG